MKKNLITKMLCLTLCGTLLLPTTASAAPQKTNITIQKQFSSYDDPILRELIEKMGLSKEEVDKIDKEIDSIAKSRSISIGTLIAIITAVKLTYDGGKYAARQCEVRLGITKAHYRANRQHYRSLLTTTLLSIGLVSAPFLLGFDDYFMGV